MKHPRRTIILIVSGIVAVTLFLFITRPREPVYQGRTLHEWVATLHGGLGTNSISHQLLTESVGPKDACQAISHIGPAAVPYLMQDLQARSLPVADFCDGLLRKVPLIRWQLPGTTSRTEEARVRAAIALYILGPTARPAQPVAAKLLAAPRRGTYGVAAGAAVLAGLGEDGLPALRSALSTNGNWTSACAVWALAQMGERAKPAVPDILRIARARPSGDHLLEFWALDTLGAESGEMLALAVADLQSTNQWLNNWKSGKLDWLAKHKEISPAAVPVIIPLLTNSDADVRQSASNALWKIDQRMAQDLGVSAPEENKKSVQRRK